MKTTKILTLFAGMLLAANLYAAAPDGGGFLADRHAARGVKCEVCHSDVAKGTMKLDANRHEACVQCHGWYDEVAKKTAPADPEEMNPHSQHDGNLPCSTCHKGHKKGENYCGNCHYYNFTVP